MLRTILMVGTVLALATFARTAFAQAPDGAFDFGGVEVTNTVATGGGVNCGIFNTSDPHVGNSTIALRGNGKNAVKFFLNDITYYTTAADGSYINAFTYAGSVIMTFTSTTGGSLRWIADAMGDTYNSSGTPKLITFLGLGTFSNYDAEAVAGGGFSFNFSITIKDCQMDLVGTLYP